MNTNGRFGALGQLSLIGRRGMRARWLLVISSLVAFLVLDGLGRAAYI